MLMSDTGNSAPGAVAAGGMTLRTEGLVKRYGKRTVVNNVSINVRQGEIVGLLGPNGAGKTTSFYMTTGLIVPNAGRIFLDGLDITDYPVYKRARAGIGYLAQENSVFRKLSVEDNIMAVLEMTGKPRAWQLGRLESLIAEFRLGKVRKNKGDQLSGGERRRTEIARCLAISPKFIMLDEPFAGVDPIAVGDIQKIVWELKYRNIGILITDHNVYETLSITDRAYLLFEGRILFQGVPEELAANEIVREKYLGSDFVLRKKDFQMAPSQGGESGSPAPGADSPADTRRHRFWRGNKKRLVSPCDTGRFAWPDRPFRRVIRAVPPPGSGRSASRDGASGSVAPLS